ncbi:hypothetical protein BCV69DRAFT_283602 [Microstroma glucosiphilum]|uniref:Phosphatidate phosphatase APP1 catalytic domain-containing protein n=1 Tax=Pseudomicrostroma glucosiphilum TaxID=1684307 RepID=A0A316U4F9_9BASI|nr:hypothetical protein BCV69DRAFT_283602 [Pseudomicrostroma glucosiphilum]PWN20070.1 hypothetical protein BCV69DRAFT_283602 [Pseudomicrostroma glucosiphilum]
MSSYRETVQSDGQRNVPSTSSTSITGYHIRARVSQGASQVGSKEYWSSWKASAKQKAAEVRPAIRQWNDGGASQSSSISAAQAPGLGYAPYRPRSRARIPESVTSSQTAGFSTSSLSLKDSPPEDIYPVLLPGYTFTRRDGGGDEELIVTLRGFVARKPAIHGRAQRMFNLMAKQLARLPKPLSASSTSLLLHPSETSVDDSHFFPSVPQGWASSSPAGETPSGTFTSPESQYQRQHLSERLVEGITDRMHEETLGKLVSKLGALPIDGEGGVHDEPDKGPGAKKHTADSDEEAASPPPPPPKTELAQISAQQGVRGVEESQTRAGEIDGSSTVKESVRAAEGGSAPSLTSPSTTSVSSAATSNTTATSTTATSSSSAPSAGPSRLTKLKRMAPSRTPSTASLLSLSSNPTVAADAQLVGGSQAWASRTLDEIHQLTHNLNERLADFWIYRVAMRKVRVEVQGEFVEPGTAERTWQTLLAQELKSDLNGMFRLRVNLGPLGVFEDRLQGLRTRAVLLEDVAPTTTHAALEAIATPPPTTPWCPLSLARSASTQTPIRLISDVDDTIRQTCVVQGFKSVFRQVFILPHSEVVVPGMAEWYHSLAQDYQIGIHFVSNAPIELWKPIKEFLDHAGMPAGHLHLKSYNSDFEGATVTANTGGSQSREDSEGGSGGDGPTVANTGAGKASLLSTWLQPASARKRAAIVSILDDFPETGFLLVGDTGELDLELYSELAKERPHQIKALYLRDVTSEGYVGPTSAREEFNVGEEEKRSRKAAARKAGEAIKRPVKAFAEASSRASSRPTSPTLSRTAERGGAKDFFSSQDVSSGAASASSTPQPRPTMAKTRTGTPTERTLSAPRLADSQLDPASTPPVTLPSAAPRSGSTTTTRRSPALQVRINKALAIMPAGTEIHFFKEGEDVRAESERLIRELRGEGSS